MLPLATGHSVQAEAQCTVKDPVLTWAELLALLRCPGYITLHLRNEGNGGQRSRSVIRIQRGHLQVCFENSKAFYKQNGTVISNLGLSQKGTPARG